jgi:hypothetical protein
MDKNIERSWASLKRWYFEYCFWCEYLSSSFW